MRAMIGAALCAAMSLAMSGCVGAGDPLGAQAQEIDYDCEAVLASAAYIPVTAVLSATTTPAVTAGGATVVVSATGTGTTWSNAKTCVGLYDSGLTSATTRPQAIASRRAGAIAGPVGAWTNTTLSVSVNPAGLSTAPGGKPYWLRMITQTSTGWEVAEGVLMAN